MYLHSMHELHSTRERLKLILTVIINTALEDNCGIMIYLGMWGVILMTHWVQCEAF